MKRFSRFFCFLLAVLLAACSGWLDDVDTGDQLALSEVFQTGAELDAALIGAYDLVQQREVLGSYMPALGDLLAGNAEGWFQEVTTLQVDASHWLPENIWTQSYRAVNQLNALLAALPEVLERDPSFTLEAADRIEAEALFLRGVLWFELVRLFALPYGHAPETDPGIPLMTEPVLSGERLQFPARATVAQVYAQAEADLEAALEILPETNARGRATTTAAQAYLARIAFQMGDYATAAERCLPLLTDPALKLNADPIRFFRQEGSPEEVWVIFSETGTDQITWGLSRVYDAAFITEDLRRRGFAAAVPAFQRARIAEQDSSWQIVDLRCDPDSLLSPDPILRHSFAGDSTRCFKYESPSVDTDDDTPNARLSEFLLLRAEALARTQGLNPESIELLNRVRTRSLRIRHPLGFEVEGGSAFFAYALEDFPDAEALIEAVILERRIELAFEGHYFHDLMRLKRPVLNAGTTYPYDHPRLRLPIPAREIDANPNLEQNPGY